MRRTNFSEAAFIELTPEAIPTILGYDPRAGSFVVGEAARTLARAPRPVVQDFKQYIGESSAMFEGRYASVRDARPQRLWEVRPEEKDANRWLSTKEATKKFLQEFFAILPQVPDQLIVGVPATTNDTWLKEYRAHLSEVLSDLGKPEPQFFPEPFAVFQYYRTYEGLIPRSSEPLAILVIDFAGVGPSAGASFETTLEGNLAEGGSTSVPLGIQSVLSAGKAIDKRLLEVAIGKLKHPALKQEAPDGENGARPWLLLVAEERDLRSRIASKTAALTKTAVVFRSRCHTSRMVHPDVPVTLSLNGEDLRERSENYGFLTEVSGNQYSRL